MLRRGDYEPVHLEEPRLMAFRRTYEDESMLVVINLSDEPARVPGRDLDIAAWDYAVVE